MVSREKPRQNAALLKKLQWLLVYFSTKMVKRGRNRMIPRYVCKDLVVRCVYTYNILLIAKEKCKNKVLAPKNGVFF